MDTMSIAEEHKKDKESISILTKQLHDANEKYSLEMEKLREECELFKKDSFEARLELQNMDKELMALRSEHKVLSLDYKSLKEQIAAKEKTNHEAQDAALATAKDFQKSREDFQKTREVLEGRYRQSQAESEKLKNEYEEFRKGLILERRTLEEKCQDSGFHKIAFEQLSQEHELMRRELLALQELHKNDSAAIDDLSRKLEFAKQALEAEKQSLENTQKLEELLEKQIAIQKIRAAELGVLEQENKTLKEHFGKMKKALSEKSKNTEG